VGVLARYPQYRARSATVETLQYRINDCFRRSMNGLPLATDGPDMRDIVAYLWFLSRDVPVAPAPMSNRLAKWAALAADTAAGARVYATACVKCHGEGGEGTAVAPPVWGTHSYNIGAGMARVRTAADSWAGSPRAPPRSGWAAGSPRWTPPHDRGPRATSPPTPSSRRGSTRSRGSTR